MEDHKHGRIYTNMGGLKLEMIEDELMIKRKRNKFYVEVGNLSKHKIKQLIKNFKQIGKS